MAICHKGWILDMYTLTSLEKDGVSFYFLGDMQGRFLESRETITELIQELQRALTVVTDKDVAELNKQAWLKEDPRWFLKGSLHNY